MVAPKATSRQARVARAAYDGVLSLGQPMSMPTQTAKIGSRVRTLREARGITQEELGHAIGTDKTDISKLETGKRRDITIEKMTVLAKALRVDVADLVAPRENERLASGARSTQDPLGAPLPWTDIVGEVRAGNWQEMPDAPPEALGRIAVPIEPFYERFPRHALKVVGPSVDKIYPDGSSVVCIKFIDLGDHPKDGDLVVVYRRNRVGLTEATIKRLVFERKNWSLKPESNHPDHQTPLVLEDPGSDDENEDIRIVALVITGVVPAPRRSGARVLSTA